MPKQVTCERCSPDSCLALKLVTDYRKLGSSENVIFAALVKSNLDPAICRSQLAKGFLHRARNDSLQPASAYLNGSESGKLVVLREKMAQLGLSHGIPDFVPREELKEEERVNVLPVQPGQISSEKKLELGEKAAKEVKVPHYLEAAFNQLFLLDSPVSAPKVSVDDYSPIFLNIIDKYSLVGDERTLMTYYRAGREKFASKYPLPSTPSNTR